MELLKRLLTLLRMVAFAAACLVVGVASLLFAVEKSGWLEAMVEGRIAEVLGDLGPEFSIEGASLRWFEPSLVLEGIAVGPNGRVLRLERTEIAIGRDAATGGLGLNRILVAEGRVEVGPEFQRALERFLASRDEPALLARPNVGRFPNIIVRDVQVDWSHPEWGDIPLGRIDLRTFENERGEASVEGRVIPTLVSSDAGENEIYVRGVLDEEQNRLEWQASARAIPLALQSLPEGTALERLREYQPGGVLSLNIGGSYPWGGESGEPARGSLRASVRDGSLRVPRTDHPVEEVRTEVRARFDAPAGDFFDPSAWEVTARVEGKWNATPVVARAAFGRAAPPGYPLGVWIEASRLGLEDSLLELFGEQGEDSELRRAWSALAPRGRADVRLGLHLRFGSEGPVGQIAAELDLIGETGATFYGWPRPSGEPQGFPIPMEEVTGRVLVIFDTESAPLGHLGLVDLHGSNPEGEGGIDGVIAWLSAESKRPVMDLHISGDLAVGEAIHGALDGLEAARWVWPAFRPHGGSVSVRGRLVRPTTSAKVMSSFTIDLSGAGMTWKEIPIEVSDVDGRVELTLARGEGTAISYALDGKLSTADHVRIAGRYQEDPKLIASGLQGEAARIEVTTVEAKNLSLRGVDRDVIVQTYPGVGLALEEATPVGKIDLGVEVRRPTPGAPLDFDVEIVPRVVRLTPLAFAIPTSDLRGRLLVNGSVPPENKLPPRDGAAREETLVSTRVAPLCGEWTGNVVVACMGEFPARTTPAGDEHEMRIFGAGIDPSNRNLVGALAKALSADDSAGLGAIDLSNLRISGRVDGRANIRIGEETESVYRIFLRNNDFVVIGAADDDTEVFRLDELRGILEQVENRLYGDRISAVLGTTPVLLLEPRFFSEDGEFQLETRLKAELPIDRTHLKYFLDEETLTALIDRSEWSGQIDTDDALLRVVGNPGGRGRVELSGSVYPINMFVRFGVPVLIQSAHVELESLVFEGGDVRARATVDNMYCNLADRQIERAEMVVSYFEPRLSILELDGDMEGGRISDLRSTGAMSGSPFAIDLLEPFPFDVAVRLAGVRVKGLLRDVFDSDLANRGTVDAELRLAGTLDDPSTIYGSGYTSLRKARLWSIPVVRDLFSLFGFDGTAVFESIRALFFLREGVIELTGIDARSPFIHMVGEGTLDLDGSLKLDFKPRIAFVERLPLFKKLARKFQNSLLTVKVRGDMDRPKVYKRWILGDLFSSDTPSPHERDLPLPQFSALPRRF